ncbi:MAG: hypothetical protein ACFFDN_00010 [Candidatus Hodarchaeota archaeon]
MEIEEIQRRLNEEELLFCPECDLFHPETEVCEIICCNNPFTGPYEEEIKDHINLIIKCFNLKESEVGND